MSINLDRSQGAMDKEADASRGSLLGGAYLAKSDSAKSETAVQERAKPYFAKPVI